MKTEVTEIERVTSIMKQDFQSLKSESNILKDALATELKKNDELLERVRKLEKVREMADLVALNKEIEKLRLQLAKAWISK